MDDLRSRFASLDAVAVPDLRSEIERRAAALADRPMTRVVGPQVGWRATPASRGPLGRRFAGIPVLVIVALLTGVVVGSIGLAAGWWWDRSTVLVPPSNALPRAIVPAGDCAGAVRTDEGAAPPFRGWGPGPGPGFLTSAKPGPITALWHESDTPVPPPDVPRDAVSLVEVDPIARTSCRLMSPIKIEDMAGLQGVGVPDAAWTTHGGAFAIFRGNVEGFEGCCGPGELLVWSPTGYSAPVAVEEDFGELGWSNRGGWLAVNRGAVHRNWAEVTTNDISFVPADGTAPHDLQIDCEQCVLRLVAFSPDDRLIAISAWQVNATKTDVDNRVVVADVATGSAVALDAGRSDVVPVGWADDGTILALDAGHRLVAIPVDAPAELRVVAELPIDIEADGEDIWAATWSPDLSKVALLQIVWIDVAEGPHAGRQAVWDVAVLDVRSGAIHYVDRGIARNSEFIWAPDSRTFAYTVEVDPFAADKGVVLKVADAFEGDAVSIGLGVSPVAWRTVWR